MGTGRIVVEQTDIHSRRPIFSPRMTFSMLTNFVCTTAYLVHIFADCMVAQIILQYPSTDNNTNKNGNRQL